MADLLRIVCIVVASVGLGWTSATLFELSRCWRALPLTKTFVHGITAVLLGVALLTISALFTEAGRIGTVPTWRLPTNLLGVSVGLLGAVRLHTALRRAIRRSRS